MTGSATSPPSADRAVLTAIRLDGSPEVWTNAGFVEEHGSIRLGNVLVDLDPGSAPSLGFDRDVGESFDGLGVHVAPPAPGEPTRHPNGVDGLDHVVIMSASLDATLEGLDPRLFEVRRIRDTTMAGSAVSQAFVVAGSAVLEIVGPRRGDTSETAGGAATLWGIAATATDLAACARYWGDRCSAPRPAVQAGRQILSLKRSALPSDVALAVMSPRTS